MTTVRDSLPEELDPSSFIVHEASPLNLETAPDAVGEGFLTPVRNLFVRCNLEVPSAEVVADRDAWEVEIAGVARPRALSVGELRRLGVRTVAAVLQCSGNGRHWFEHGPTGVQWGPGAVGCALWTGVPVGRVVEALGGAVDGARYLTATGGEELPEDVDRLDALVERSVPLAKGLDDAILCWEVNGEPLPRWLGGPLRLLVPGYYGVNHVKWLRRLACTAVETQAKIQATDYRVTPIGVTGTPEYPSMWGMSVKSWITAPADGDVVTAGRCRIDGVAIGGEEAVADVEVSVDGGATWTDAELYGPDMGRFGWRRFSHAFDAAAGGRYVVASRARNTAGDVQVEHRVENERGYGNASWRDHRVTVQAADG